MPDTPKESIETIEMPYEVTPEVVETIGEILSSNLAEQGFEVETGPVAEGELADIVIRGRDGAAVTFQLKATPDERIADARDTLQKIRERNQNVEQRLQRLRTHLATA